MPANAFRLPLILRRSKRIVATTSGRNPSAAFRCFLSLTLTFLLAVPPGVAVAAPPPAKLNIVILSGDGAINNIRQRTARETIVQVEDENHRPVAGASVLFLLPDSGPGGVFANGSRSLQVLTNKQGQAMATGLRVNNVPGKFQIQVEVSHQELSATASITQTNAVITAAAAGGISGKLIAILAATGAAAAVGVIAATRKGDNDDKGVPTTVSAGTSSVGGPH